MSGKKRVVVIGGGFSGLFVARDLTHQFDVTVIDAKEFFEYTPGILRAYVAPAHFDALSFTLAPAIKRMGCQFIWGEVKSLDGDNQRVTYKSMYSSEPETIGFDYCMICSGCNFNFLHKWGESLWFPTIYEDARPHSNWKHLDERYIEGRRRHLMEEHGRLSELNAKGASILVAGAGFIGVEWVTELEHFFPNLKLHIIDFLPNCLGPLPVSAQKYCEDYMSKKNIGMTWGIKYEPNSPAFWKKIGWANGADHTYVCMGVKASNYFMPKETLSDKGPGGGGWIYINKELQVTNKDGKVWGNGRVWAVGDCNFGCVGGPAQWKDGTGMAPIPKISYPGEEQALHAIKNLRATSRKADGPTTYLGGCFDFLCVPKKTQETWWPWGAGMFATSLGPDDACFVFGANSEKGSGQLGLWGALSAVQKEIIESSKTDECKDGWVGWAIWYFVHHTPVHLWGPGKWR